MGQSQRQDGGGGRRSLEDYVGVHTRVELFRKQYPLARLITTVIKDEPLTVRCEVYLDGNDSGIPNSSGMADEQRGMGGRGNSTLEKVETAAVGRCLAFLGYEIKEGIASRDEMRDAPPLKAVPAQKAQAPKPPNRQKMIARVSELMKQARDQKIDLPQSAFIPQPEKRSDDDLLKLGKWIADFIEQKKARGPAELSESSALRARIYAAFQSAPFNYSAEDTAVYLRDHHAGKSLEEMTLDELNAVADGMELKR